jgi:hypothetical protein
MLFFIARHVVMITSIGNRIWMKMTIALHMFVYTVLIARTIQSYTAWQAVRMQMSVAPLASVTDAVNYPPTQDVRIYYQSIFGRVDLVQPRDKSTTFVY